MGDERSVGDSIFTKIFKGEIPGVKVYEDDVCVVLMDKFPATKGQCLVVPKKQVDYILDLDEKTYQHIWEVARRIAKAIDSTFDTIRCCFVVEGFEVPHVHIRVHPCYERHMELNGDEEDDSVLKENANKIKENL